MGLPEDYELPENYNEAYHLTGDGVVVPVVRHLAENLFEPIIFQSPRGAKEAGMTVIPCEQNKVLRERIEEYCEVLKVEAHKLGNHGLTEQEFYNSGLFSGAIERIRGQFSATMRDKRDFVKRVLNYMQKTAGFIKDWDSAGNSNRHDYSVRLPSGKIAVIELKGCLDGNNPDL